MRRVLGDTVWPGWGTVELAIWRAAAEGTYEPASASTGDPAFRGYRTFERRWAQELAQIRRAAGSDGDTRFYIQRHGAGGVARPARAGLAERLFTEGVWLETQLAEALP